MAKENPWFKFEPAEWAFGRIQRQSKDVKVCFMDLMCKYWHERCEMSLEDAQLDFGHDEIEVLIKNKIITTDKEFILIKFLDVQWNDIQSTSKQNSVNGKKSAQARKLKKEKEREPNDSSTTVQRNPTDKKREEETKQEEKRKEEKEVYSNEVHECFRFCIQYFPERLKPKDDRIKNNWLDTIDKLHRIDNLEFSMINKIVEHIRKDGFWANQFLAIPKLRKTRDADGLKYIQVFYEHLKNPTNGKGNSNNKNIDPDDMQDYLRKKQQGTN